MLTLKLLRAKLENGRANHPHPKARQRRTRADPRQLLAQHLVLFLRKTATAILGRPVWRGPALGSHALQPELLVFTGKREVATTPALVTFLGHRLTHTQWAVFIQPGTGLLAEGIKIGHRYSP